VALVCELLTVYLLILFARAVLSWFPIRPDSGLVTVLRVLDRIIDPVLQPIRRVVPPMGMLDMSYLVLVIAVLVIKSIVCGGTII
jgi:YggT family protein